MESPIQTQKSHDQCLAKLLEVRQKAVLRGDQKTVNCIDQRIEERKALKAIDAKRESQNTKARSIDEIEKFIEDYSFEDLNNTDFEAYIRHEGDLSDEEIKEIGYLLGDYKDVDRLIKELYNERELSENLDKLKALDEAGIHCVDYFELRDVYLHDCTMIEFATDRFNEAHSEELEEIPESIRDYIEIDFESYAKDLEQGGYYVEVECNGFIQVLECNY